MPEKLKQCIPMLEVLIKTNDDGTRRKYLRLFHDCILKAVREICLNLLVGNIDLTVHEKARLRKYKKALRKLADPQTSIREKSELLLKQGKKILSHLLPPTLRRLKHV